MIVDQKIRPYRDLALRLLERASRSGGGKRWGRNPGDCRGGRQLHAGRIRGAKAGLAAEGGLHRGAGDSDGLRGRDFRGQGRGISGYAADDHSHCGKRRVFLHGRVRF
ncbi:hypothetical protein D1872_239150 [compost metagenome]